MSKATSTQKLMHYPILNSYSLDLKLIHKFQQLDNALLKAVKEDPRFKLILIYSNR